METKRLYHKDSYQTKFQAIIVDKYPVTEQGKLAIVLNQTCFYPNSGGQINDRGTIEGIPVLAVEEEGDKIAHYLEQEIKNGIGDSVNGEIDWYYRLDHMQQHTGQHILSGVLMELWQRETQSFHMGEDICTLDILTLPLDEERMKEVEWRANQIVYENRAVQHYFSQNKIKLRTDRFKEKQEKLEQLRIIDIENFDKSACGGTHCERTGEVGIIKILGWENRKDKIRISFLCGCRALGDYQTKHLILKTLSHFFTTGIGNLEEKIRQLSLEQKELIKSYNKMEKRINEWESAELQAKSRREIKGISLIEKIFSEQKIQNLNQIAMLLAKEEKTVIILASEGPEPAICLAHSADLNCNLKEIMDKLLSEFNGKGGGSNNLVLGKLERREDIKEVCQRAVELIT
ncbi:MAG: hypothetical protein GX240_03725 [Candidatus Atribacteria bacterium]|nr:hypothetical protein [Candidatus Atribacteria bacterium]